MLKCSRCGQYYIPGYLDCNCRIKGRRGWTTTDSSSRDKPGMTAKSIHAVAQVSDKPKTSERS